MQSHHPTAQLLLTALLTLLLAHTPAGAQPTPPPSIANTIEPAEHNADAVLVVHYCRPDANYTGWNLWTWPDGAEGRAIPFSGKTEASRYAVVPLANATTRQGFIVRKGNWADKDIPHDRFVTLDTTDPTPVTEIWLVAGDQRIFTDPADVDLTVRVINAFLDASDTITLAATGLLENAQRKRATITTRGSARSLSISSFTRAPSRASARILYDIKLRKPVHADHVASLILAIPGHDQLTVFARDALSEPRFTALDAKLGATYSPNSTTFRVWSPVADSVDLLLFPSTNAPQPDRTIPLTRTTRGVWQATLPGDLHATPYQYQFISYAQTRTAPDIYARAATLDSSRSVVVDLTRTNPDNWSRSTAPILQNPTDEIIYETHVRDFSIADTSLDPELRATYLGLIHEGRIDNILTGLAHLKELGVTAVHLLPIHDFTANLGDYNWGYWTALFNVPESNYSTDPHDPTQAIRDLKAAIQTLHDNDIRVILDVVYNHTSSSFEHSPFDQAVPWYYFRTTPDGRLRNDAGTGNSIADERPMVRKFITDSTAYWVTEYNVDGLRFDLVGTHNPQTVRAICDTLAPIRSDLTLYGEPWTGGGPLLFPKGAQKNTCFAVFNDHLRNAIRGDLDGTSTGIATGPGGDTTALIRGVSGAIDDFTAQPTEAVNYVSAHDNRTLWDKLVHTHPNSTDAERRAMHKLAIGIVLTSQGIAFLHAGSDFARTKQGNHNSYNAGDRINRIDWPRKAEYRDVFDYTRGLIALRRAHPAFRMPDADLIRHNLTVLHERPLIAFTLDGRAVNDPWSTILVAYNPDPRPHDLKLPRATWTLVVNHERAGTTSIRRANKTITLPPYSMTILHK